MISLLGISFPLVYLHLSTLLAVFCCIVYADHLGLQWFLGKRETLPEKTVTTLHYLMWIGLVAMMVTGAVMAWPLQEYLQATPAFWVKMMFVGALFVNGFFIGKFSNIASQRAFATLTSREKIPLFISGAVSTGSWVGAVIAAKFMGL